MRTLQLHLTLQKELKLYVIFEYFDKRENELLFIVFRQVHIRNQWIGKQIYQFNIAI
jgi:hypothetical protein